MGADLHFEQNVFWRLLGPDDTQSDRSQKFFGQTDKHDVLNQWPLSNIHILIEFVFQKLQKIVRKMPKFKNGTALSWVFPDSALKSAIWN